MTHSPRPHLRALVGDEQAFLTDHWERALALHRGGAAAADRFSELLSSDDLVEMIADHGLRSPFFRLIRDGSGLPSSTYLRSAGAGHTTVHDLANPGRIAEEAWAGASIVGQALQRTWPPARDLCRGLAEELGHRVQANAYLSPPAAEGFDLHYDTHDVFVLQVEGTKHWTVHEPADVLPHRRGRGAPPPAFGEPVWSGTLEPGDCLYLPRGFGHQARTSDAASLHLTVGVLAFTWRHVLRLLADVLPDDDVALRRALPVGALGSRDGRGDDGFDEAWKEFRVHLAERLDALDPELLVGRLEHDLWSAHPPVDAADELRRALRAAAPDATTLLELRHGALERHEVAGGRVRLVRRDRVISLPVEAAPLVDALVAGRHVRADDGLLDCDSSLVVLRRLYREGIVERVDR
ncbi:MAG: hypothetical protein JNK12_21580 [Acidimicrobiales bacterium]|nr:hypothetical protein [Acidimicrobiales bacterium]